MLKIKLYHSAIAFLITIDGAGKSDASLQSVLRWHIEIQVRVKESQVAEDNPEPSPIGVSHSPTVAFRR